MKFGGKSGNLNYKKFSVDMNQGQTETVSIYNKEVLRLKAKERIEKEKDPEKKRIMENLYKKGEYNLYFIFGPEG